MLTTYGRVPIPAGPDVDDIPGILAAAFGAIDSQFVLQATDATDRDSKYGAGPKGMLVCTQDNNSLWLKTVNGTPTWDDVLYDTGWVTTGFVAGDDFTISQARIRKIGKIGFLHCVVGYGGTGISPTTTGPHAGNVGGDPTVLTLPALARPDTSLWGFSGRSTFGGVEYNLTNTGVLGLTALSNGDMSISDGEFLYATTSFPAA